MYKKRDNSFNKKIRKINKSMANKNKKSKILLIKKLNKMKETEWLKEER
jgi:hypothetical protein